MVTFWLISTSGWTSGFGVGKTNTQGTKMLATKEELQELSSR